MNATRCTSYSDEHDIRCILDEGHGDAHYAERKSQSYMWFDESTRIWPKEQRGMSGGGYPGRLETK